MDISNCYKLWNEFLSVWPIERLKNMTLQEYSQAGDKDNFTYWVERETKPIANILGGSAFKFGIYHRSASEKKQNGRGKIYQEDYAWLEKYGATQEQAFNTVKQYILDTVAFIQQGNLDAIDALDFSPVFKWKIAFLYQNQAEPRVISIFSKTMLDFLTKDKELNYAQVYQYLLSKKDDESLLQYSQDLVQQYLQAHPKKAYLTPNEADEILNAKYPDQYISRQKMTVVTNESGREIALVLTGSKASFFIEIDPEDNGQFKFNFKSSKDVPNGKYLEHDGRHSGLKSQSKNLWLGQKAFYIDIDSVKELEKFCDWYEQGTDHTTVFERQVNSSELMDSVMIQQPLNRILFGAAGTGKTYHTINHALAIVENKELVEIENQEKQPDGRKKLKDRFDKLKSEGRIKFVTFHQSFSYEDFIEGIRAETNQQGQLRYDVKAGVFKEICDQAKQISNNQIFTQFSQPIEFGKGYILKKMNTELLEIQKPNGNVIHLSRVLSDFLLKEFRNGKITDRDLAEKKVIEILDESEILEPYLVNGYSAIWANLIPFLDNLLHSAKPVVKEKSKYVIIIDEINRGNISRIFGELITLIEDSKRQDAEEELSVTLPYSKEEFTVPSNVYIIGTMNSSDRSLTGLDIALRRRFTFVEMQPKPELLNDIEVEGLNIGKLLKVINQRIEVLLDRDHCIGHANFMSLKKQPTLEHLESIFKQKIIPQLQEYFFDDWTKINLVFFNNKMVVEDQEIKITGLFPPNTGGDLHYSEQKKIWKINEDTFKTIDAFVNILGSKG